MVYFAVQHLADKEEYAMTREEFITELKKSGDNSLHITLRDGTTRSVFSLLIQPYNLDAEHFTNFKLAPKVSLESDKTEPSEEICYKDIVKVEIVED